MMRFRRMSSVGLAFTAALVAAPFTRADELSDQIQACVLQRVSPAVSVNESRGRVDCPAADMLGLTLRRHDLGGTIAYVVPAGSVILPGTDAVSVEVVSSNGGARGDIAFATDRMSASVPIACVGPGLGQGKTWFEAKLKVRVVKQVDLRSATLECARSARVKAQGQK